MEDEYVQALQYTPHPGPSLEVVHTLSLHALLSLSSPFHSFSVSCCSPSYNLPLEMSEPVEAKNQPGILDTNMPAGTGMVETMVAQLAEAYPRPKWRKVTILHR